MLIHNSVLTLSVIFELDYLLENVELITKETLWSWLTALYTQQNIFNYIRRNSLSVRASYTNSWFSCGPF